MLPILLADRLERISDGLYACCYDKTYAGDDQKMFYSYRYTVIDNVTWLCGNRIPRPCGLVAEPTLIHTTSPRGRAKTVRGIYHRSSQIYIG
jgi:hypothetical protein